jgi:hypothetical protein
VLLLSFFRLIATDAHPTDALVGAAGHTTTHLPVLCQSEEVMDAGREDTQGEGGGRTRTMSLRMAVICRSMADASAAELHISGLGPKAVMLARSVITCTTCGSVRWTV